MKKTAIISTLFLAIFTIYCGGNVSVQAQEKKLTGSTDSKELEAFLDPLVTKQMAERNIPGGAIVIVKDGKIIFSKGYGYSNLEKKTPVVADKTIFRIGSITKGFTATAMVQLAERKKINLNDDVNKYLKDLKIQNTYPKPITFANLLTHSGGLDEINLGRKTANADEVIPMNVFLKDRLIRWQAPGETMSYSTYGITLAGNLIETISGDSYKEYMTKNIFQPLGMDRTSVASLPAELQSSLAMGYAYQSGTQHQMAFEYFHTLPASDINGTVTDMGKYMIAMLEDGKNKNGRILSKKAAKEMHTQQFTNHPKLLGMTYGFFESKSNNVKSIYHGGSMAGFSSFMYMSKDEKLGIFITQNSETGRMSVLIDILNRYYPYQNELKTTRIKENLERFKGQYRADFYCHSCKEGERGWVPRLIDIFANDNGTLSFWNNEWTQIEPLVFQMKNGLLDTGETIVVFREDKNKKIIGMFQGAFTHEKLPQNSLAREMEYVILNKGNADGVKLFQKLKDSKNYYVNEDELNTAGYNLLGQKNIVGAIEVFKINAEMFSDSWNALDSLGEGYLMNKDYELSLKSYKKSIELNPNNNAGKEAIIKIEQIIKGDNGGVTSQMSEEDKVRIPLNNYLMGHKTRKIIYMKKAFHREGKLIFIRDGKYTTWDFQDYISRFGSGNIAADEDQRTRTIESIDISGNAAIAKLVLDYPTTRFVDYVSLLKINGEWKIVSKVFYAEPKQ